MYKIKSKKGFNVIIADINITLDHDSESWIYVDEKIYDKSEDAKKLSKLIIKCKADDKKTQNEEDSVGQYDIKNVQNMFVKDPENILVDENKIDNTEIKIEEQSIVINKEIVSVEKTEVEEIKLEDKKAETKAETKTETKKETNKKAKKDVSTKK